MSYFEAKGEYRMESYGTKCYWIILLSYLTVLGINIDLRIQNTNGNLLLLLLEAAGGFSVEQLFLFVGMCVFYAYALQHIMKAEWMFWDKVCVIIPAVLFAGFMVVGYSFAQTNSLDLILKNKLQMFKSIISFAGYGIGFVISIAWFYTWLTDLRLFREEGQLYRKGFLRRYKDVLIKAPFCTVLLTLLIVYIPYTILSYPAIFMGDTRHMITQGFNFYDETANYLILIDENVRLNGHHPVIYTLFIHACLLIGKFVFKSYNIGIFLVAISQLLMVCAVVAIAIHILARRGIHENILLGLIAYFAFAPRIQCHMFLITKDVFSACMMLLFLLSVFQSNQGKVSEKRARTEIIFCGVAVGLFRNDGKYIILGSIVIMLFLIKEHRKMFLISGVTIAVCMGLFSNVLMPAFHITPTSRRESLSVLFQQTARYFRDYPEEITEEEWKAVSAVLDTDSIRERYNPEQARFVKYTFHEAATREELMTYFRIWFQMGLKHPGVYVQATLNNYYNYFYPGTKLADNYSYSMSQDYIKKNNNQENLQNIGVVFYYPEILDEARTKYEKLRESIFELPVISLLRSPAAYVWTLMLLVFYLIKGRNYKGLALTMPLLLSVGICFLGPRNGNYFRYLYGVSVCLPIVFFLCLYLCKTSETSKNQH